MQSQSSDIEARPELELDGADQMFFEYLVGAYQSFMTGEDDYDAMDEKLIANFEFKNEGILRDVEAFEKEHETLQTEYKHLTETEVCL